MPRKKLRPYDEPPRARRGLIPASPDAAATAFLIFAALWLAVALGIGMLRVAIQIVGFGVTYELGIFDLALVFDFATVEAAFLGALVFGWLGNAGLAAIFFITPRLLGRPMALPAIAFGAAIVWNVLAVAPGIASVYLNIAAPGQLAEFLLPIDGAILLALGMANLSFWVTLLRPWPGIPYVSLWYFAVALLAFPGIYLLGALPEAIELLPGDFTLGEPLTTLINLAYVRLLEGYWILGVAVGTLYYVVPRATGNPLFSSGLALLGFAIWVSMAAPSAAGRLVAPEVPFVVTTLGITATILLVAHGFLVAANLALTFSGRWSLVLGRGTLPLAAVALTFLLATPVLEAIGSLRQIQVNLALTDWPLGVLLFATLGTATFAFLALADHALPRLLRRSWSGGPLPAIQMWTIFGGTTLAGLAFMAGGLAHASMIGGGMLTEDVAAGLMLYRGVAAAGLGLAGIGAVALLANLFLMYTAGRPVVQAASGQAHAAAAGH